MYKLEKRIKLEKDDNIENADTKVPIIFLMKKSKKNENIIYHYLTPSGKLTNYLTALILLQMPEKARFKARSEASRQIKSNLNF